jgi:cobalamin synthase
LGLIFGTILYDCFCFSHGAFHEDGFADVCDGFGGGWTKEKILMIMKTVQLRMVPLV